MGLEDLGRKKLERRGRSDRKNSPGPISCLTMAVSTEVT